MKQGGFAQLSLMQYGLIALGILAALGGIIWWADANIETSAGVKKGEANVQAKWDAQKIKDAELERRRKENVAAALLEQKKEAEAAQKKAEDAEAENRRLRDEARRSGKRLAVCEHGSLASESTAPPARGDAGPGIRAPGVGRPDGGPVVRLFWTLVGLHDGAFTGLKGEPLFGPAARYALDPARADTASPYTLDELLDVARDNAFKLSACRRDVAAARAKVDAAAEAWEKTKGGE